MSAKVWTVTFFCASAGRNPVCGRCQRPEGPLRTSHAGTSIAQAALGGFQPGRARATQHDDLFGADGPGTQLAAAAVHILPCAVPHLGQQPSAMKVVDDLADAFGIGATCPSAGAARSRDRRRRR
ncbi:hypothetical protein G6F65_021509 [Rhizopus arrhizus]|nr:hypothetical protein G6F65_021509 [Rhizopus arrhizus]